LTPDQAILLVEDNDDDVELTLLAFKEARVKNPVVRARDGVEALDYLFCRESYATRDAREVPAIVLLDLNLPRLGGLEVLKTIRADERTRYLPAVILTSSAEERDRLDAYTHYANSYVQKPVDYDRFVTATRGLGLYWLLLNQPPPRRAP
jgi:two-component system, response regulator